MKFVISYAYDVPNYADFLVDAKNENEALKKAKAAFSSGKFNGVYCQPDDTMKNERVFVLRAARDYDEGIASLEA